MEESFQNYVDTDPRWIKEMTKYNNSPLKRWLLLFICIAVCCGLTSFFPKLLNNAWIVGFLGFAIILFFVALYITFFIRGALNKMYKPSNDLECLLNELRTEYKQKYNLSDEPTYKYYCFIENKDLDPVKKTRRSFFKFKI